MSLDLTSRQITELREKILIWQASHGRHQLPWQQDVTPYKVLVSELMLQQTQVATVIPYFERWLACFPDVERLATASEDEVMRLWQGLGYYARARNLQKAARYISEIGQFPATLSDWLKVPGVGRYTAGAVLSFAYDQYGPIVDGNVRRVYARLFALVGIPNTPALEKQLWHLAEQLTPTQHCRSFAQGLLDLGATICKPRQPLCEQCPLRGDCKALLRNQVAEFPNAKPKKNIPTKAGHFLLHSDNGRVLLSKRPGAGIWPALWCLPELTQPPLQLEQAGQFQHQFSHYKLAATVYLAPVTSVQQGTTVWVSADELVDFGLPAPVAQFLRQWWQDSTARKNAE